MLKFGGSRPESDGADAKDLDRKPHRHAKRSSQVPVGASPAAAAAGGAVPMDTSRGGDSTPKVGGVVQQMAPPEMPFGAAQPPAVRVKKP